MLDFSIVDKPFILPPTRQIISTQPAPSGWSACYVVGIEDDVNKMNASVLRIPIILWVTVRFEEEGEEYEEIRHFIADPDGAIMDFMEPDLPFLCIVDPSIDFEKATKAALVDYHMNNSEEISDRLIS